MERKRASQLKRGEAMKIKVLSSPSHRGFLENLSYLTDFCQRLVVVKRTLRDEAFI
jgi:hypothetical protein